MGIGIGKFAQFPPIHYLFTRNSKEKKHKNFTIIKFYFHIKITLSKSFFNYYLTNFYKNSKLTAIQISFI
jgi:hypothetical protein